MDGAIANSITKDGIRVQNNVNKYKKQNIVIFLLTAIMLSAGISVFGSALAQKQQQAKTKPKTESFSRPDPRQPIKPTIPSANRFQANKVFLERADSLYKPGLGYISDFMDSLANDKQIVKGAVKFRHGGMWMFCDSAYYFPQKNSLTAFGHVEMRQGDTLFVYSDRLYYDGWSKHASLAKGASRGNVTLKNRKTTLVTDSLDYDLNQEKGWYTTGGTLSDDVNKLTSYYGEYSPATKIAQFSQNVVMVNSKDDFRITTEELLYNTATHVANINTSTRIEGRNDTILTSSGSYNTVTDNAVLTSRSTIIHKDSSNNVVTLEGDSIIYDKLARVSRAYMFRDILKTRRPMVLVDTARKIRLIGGFGEYNDSLKRAVSAEYPLLIEYSRPDTLFLRADTIETLVRVVDVWPDSLAHNWDLATRMRLKRYNSLQEIADSLIIRLQLLPRGFASPGNNIPMKRLETLGGIQKERPKPNVKPTDEDESNNAPTISSLNSIVATPIGNSANNEITVQEDSTISDGSHQKMLRRLDALGRDSTLMIPKEFRVAKALGRARFFNQQLQGVADTLIYEEFDSTLYMIRKPVIWSDRKQVYGNRIHLLFNDSTIEKAYLPNRGFLAEHVDEDFYNQLSGKEMTAEFVNKTLKNLVVKGNVATIFLPMENDSTYNRLVSAESSSLTMDMTSQKLDKLKMWPEVNGSVIPLFLIKRSQQYLPEFRWFEAIRPKREWYGNRWVWIDDLGEISQELENYFSEPDNN